MKNTILLLLLLLGATTTFAQPLVKMTKKPKAVVAKPKTVVKTKVVYVDKTAKKDAQNNVKSLPTKEETIAWLREKLNTYGVRTTYGARVKTQSFKNCYLIINECEFTLTDEHHEFFTISHFPIVGIKVGDLQNCVFEYIPFTLQPVKVIDSRYPDEIKYVGPCLGGSFNNLIQGEEGLVERIQKAFDHLATFCQEEKEKF